MAHCTKRGALTSVHAQLLEPLSAAIRQSNTTNIVVSTGCVWLVWGGDVAQCRAGLNTDACQQEPTIAFESRVEWCQPGHRDNSPLRFSNPFPLLPSIVEHSRSSTNYLLTIQRQVTPPDTGRCRHQLQDRLNRKSNPLSPQQHLLLPSLITRISCLMQCGLTALHYGACNNHLPVEE